MLLLMMMMMMMMMIWIHHGAVHGRFLDNEAIVKDIVDMISPYLDDASSVPK